jgi:hypothetical protein
MVPEFVPRIPLPCRLETVMWAGNEGVLTKYKHHVDNSPRPMSKI